MDIGGNAEPIFSIEIPLRRCIRMIDFTHCRIIPGRAYNGANGSKIAISYTKNPDTVWKIIAPTKKSDTV